LNSAFLILPNHLIAQLKDLASERGCPPEQIVVEQAKRLEGDPNLRSEIASIAMAIVSAMGRRERHDGLWPGQLLDSVCTSIVLAEMLEQCAETALLSMSAEVLETVDKLSRLTGREYDELLVEELLSWPSNRPLPPST
jgi:hypothetical protein